MGERMHVSTGSPWEETVGYSRAIRIGNRIEVAGTTAVRDGTVVGVGDAHAQTICILEIIKESIEQLGGTLGDVVRTRMFVTDISKFNDIGRAHGQFFKNIRPVSTMVEIKALVDPQLLIEIEAEAILQE